MNTNRRRHFLFTAPRLNLGAVLLAGLLGMSVPSVAERCVAAVEQACLLDDRFLVRVLYENAGMPRDARVLALEGVGLDTARFSFSPADQPDRVDLDVQLVDGRTVNGFYWVIAAGAPTGAEIEVTDVVTARTRRFVKPDGVRNLRDREAFGAEAQTVSVTLDTTRAVKKPISADGGTITVVDAQGTRFKVEFPAQALNLTTDITVTPVSSIAGLPLSGGLHGAVRIEPEGLVPARTVRLTITPAPAVARAQQATFAFRGLAGEFFLTPPLVPSTPLVVPIHRLGGYGLGAATAAELAAQLLRLPTREDDRLSQRLAGVLLAARRAGATKVPASVAPLLQQEFAARIQPKLAALKLGKVATHYAMLRNWSLSARDSGLAHKVTSEADSVATLDARQRAAVLAGLRRDLHNNADKCIGLRDQRAMVAAFSAFAELARESALQSGDAEKLKRCVRFELEWDTELHGDVALGIVEDVATVVVPLTYSQGKISGSKLVSQFPIFKAPCTTTLLSLTPVTFTVYRADIPRLNFFDAFEDVVPLRPQVTLYYDVLPGNQATKWSLKCPDVPEIITNTSWVFMYVVAHFDELDANFQFKVNLPPVGVGTILGQRSYQRTVSQVVEDTALILRHDPD